MADSQQKASPDPVPLPYAADYSGARLADRDSRGRGEFGCLLPGVIVTAAAGGTAAFTGYDAVAGISLPCWFWCGIALMLCGACFGWMNRDAE
jgi:hypothetical protein